MYLRFYHPFYAAEALSRRHLQQGDSSCDSDLSHTAPQDDDYYVGPSKTCTGAGIKSTTSTGPDAQATSYYCLGIIFLSTPRFLSSQGGLHSPTLSSPGRTNGDTEGVRLHIMYLGTLGWMSASDASGRPTGQWTGSLTPKHSRTELQTGATPDASQIKLAWRIMQPQKGARILDQ